MKTVDLIAIGFKKIPQFTVTNTLSNSLIYSLGRHRYLSVDYVGTSNEMLFIYESSEQDETDIRDLICLHNWDYDGTLTIEKVQTLINTITK